uniref:Uncharacterized protein n=1 Tax=Triticum urartu TaxID=4572 RepID=A0A8R7V9W0_TRIUA
SFPSQPSRRTNAAAEPLRPLQPPPPLTCSTSTNINGAGASRSTSLPSTPIWCARWTSTSSLRLRHRDWSTPSVLDACLPPQHQIPRQHRAPPSCCKPADGKHMRKRCFLAPLPSLGRRATTMPPR